jgi:hypothetical protein
MFGNKMKINNTLNADKVEETIEKLSIRIKERFPESSLGTTCRDFHRFTKKSKKIIQWIERPNILIRGIAFLSILLVLSGITYSFTIVDIKLKNTLTEIVTVLESSLNDIVLVGAGIFFLYTLENRLKRIRAIKFLNEIRGFAHVVDMHQLIKDPQKLLGPQEETENSPKEILSKFEMQRYLEYCSEFFSLIGKVAALYSQSIPDEVIVQSAGEIESLCSNMANKVWQKLDILNSME